MKKIIIIGSSAAGYTLAQRLLAKDSQRSVTIVTQEPFAPYDRRKLPGYFAGGVKEKELFLPLNGKETVRSGLKVTGVNCDRKTLYLKSDEKRENMQYDILAVCSGREITAPEIPGGRKEGVFCFNGLADVKAAKACVVNGPVCLYGPWNTEARRLADCLLSMKRELLFVCPDSCEGVPAGVTVINSAIVEFIGESGLQAIKLKEGKIIGTSFCLLTGPSVPCSGFLAESGIGLDEKGLVSVDADLRTGRENVFACGSVTGACDTWDAAAGQAEKLADKLETLL